MTPTNMKRHLGLGLVVALAFSMSACKSSDDEVVSTDAPPLAETEETAFGQTDATTAPAATDAAPEATTEAEAPAEGSIAEVLGNWLSTLPEGFLAIGDVEKFKEAVDASSPLLIDVREPDEYAGGHIPGAINIPVRTLAQHTDLIPSDSPVIVYCKSGLRATVGLTALGAMGYTNVQAFRPSFDGWSEAGEAVEMEPVEATPAASPLAIPDNVKADVDMALQSIPDGWAVMGEPAAVAEAIDAGSVPLDVREPGEFSEGHLPGAVNIPVRTLVENQDQIPTAQSIVYCASGHRATIAAVAMQILGHPSYKLFPAGYGAYEAAGMATE